LLLNRPLNQLVNLSLGRLSTLFLIELPVASLPSNQPGLDTRPIWPGRPKLIYPRYLVNKDAWLAAHLENQPAKCRIARGLQHYPKVWLNENRRNLGFQRKVLERVTLSSLVDSPNWTDEEATAWLD
jgi:hypothetical protein